MKKLRVMTIVGTRPEIIRLSRVIAELEAVTHHVLVHTGQNYAYELNEIFFKELEIRKPDHFLKAAGATAAETMAKVLVGADQVLQKVRPDALLILGDTNSCMAAISAKRRKVPVFHMEAGNRCFDDRVPEEINRRIVDHVSDINLPYTEHARRYLLREGIRPETVIKTGSPMREVLSYYRPKIDASDVVDRLKLKRGAYFVVSAHREENVDASERLSLLVKTLNAVARTYKRPLIFSTHPRTQKRLNSALRSLRPDIRIRFVDPLGFPDYVKLQESSFCVLSDSGTLTEESALLGFPAVMLRDQHERPEGMDNACCIISGLTPSRIEQCVGLAARHHGQGWKARVPPDYEVADVSIKVTRIILGHVEYVKSKVWKT